jgi:hypothetical protein
VRDAEHTDQTFDHFVSLFLPPSSPFSNRNATSIALEAFSTAEAALKFERHDSCEADALNTFSTPDNKRRVI